MSLPTLAGTARLVNDPELRFTTSRKALCKIRLAFNSRRKNDAGDWENADSFYVDGTLFGDAAEHVVESLSKADEVIITGRLRTDEFTDKHDNKRSAPELLVDSIGPALRFATAKVSRVQRTKADEPAF